MHSGVYFVCASLTAYLAYRELSRSPSVTPRVTDSKIAHATQAPNALTANNVSALVSVRVETDDQKRATAALLK
jgi:hypothetical protein